MLAFTTVNRSSSQQSNSLANSKLNSIVAPGMSPMNSRYDSDTGEVVATVNGRQGGRIKRNGIFWKAMCLTGAIVCPGHRVRVTGINRDQLTLFIEPLEAGYV
ncbi:MAG: NfeD family protein [Cyanobacteria bacterium J06555_13]